MLIVNKPSACGRATDVIDTLIANVALTIGQEDDNGRSTMPISVSWLCAVAVRTFRSSNAKS